MQKEGVLISKKTYLSKQIKLLALNTSDLFTDEEYAYYKQILACKTELESSTLSRKDKAMLRNKKAEASNNLKLLIQQHRGKPRVVNTTSVCDYRSFTDGKAPPYITWGNLKFTKKITEFMSEQTRAMGLQPDDITFDKIILSWRSLDVLEQVVMDGIILPLKDENRKFRFLTASAGQLRTDRTQLISENMWQKIAPQMECGMTWEAINNHGGINVNKYLAYSSLPTSATDVWDFPIEQCIVIKDFEADVTGIMDYIKPGYELERVNKTVLINHIDGCGMALPGAMPAPNMMVRAPWIKGLLSSFDFLEFCKTHDVSPVIQDVWGEEHDLVQENIKVIFTVSQFKLWKYYDDWHHYIREFKRCGCHLCATNYEENWISDTTLNYQMTQALVDFTDDEIKTYTANAKEKLNNLATDKETMLRALGADEPEDDPHLIALRIYPELLRDGYERATLKAIKRRMLLDDKSGAILCKNKRLFAIPDLYAACEFWFLGQEHPKGLLEDEYVYSKLCASVDEVDVLRSPSLYMEHAVRKCDHNPELRKWFNTNGIYTSCHDLISRVLQFDKQHCRIWK